MKEIIHTDFYDLSSIKEELDGYNACYFCMGVSSVGMKETNYHRITHDLTMHMAQTLHKINPDMTFTYVSGVGTDSSEKGRRAKKKVKPKMSC